MSAMATPFGQMWPRESGSSGLPRTPVTRSPSGPRSIVSSRPQVASHRLHTPVRVSTPAASHAAVAVTSDDSGESPARC